MSSTFPQSIAIAPTSREELFIQYGVVAVLVPNSQAAVEGFSELVDQIILTPTMYKGLVGQPCLFLFNQEKRSMEEILDIGATPFLDVDNQEATSSIVAEPDNVGNASDTTCGSTPIESPLWHGFVGISLRKQPQAAILGGWSVGFQPILRDWLLPPGRSPDIPICSDSRGRLAGIHRHHVLLGFVRGTGILGMKTVRLGQTRAKCDARPITNELQRPLTAPTHLIELGSLQYWMAYVQLRGTADEARRRELETLTKSMPGGTVLRNATATPTDGDTIVGMWRILGEAGRGASNVMVAAIHKQSCIVGVSRYRQKSAPDYHKFRQELASERSTTAQLAASRFGRCHIQRLLETSDHGEAYYAFYAPLCSWDLGTLLEKEDYSDLERQVLFTQLVLALRDLHAIHRIHGDIKPKNICVQTRSPLCLVVVDTAGIRECPDGGLPCTPGRGGTVGYLAPEREAVSTYGKPADVWAAGCVGIEMLLRKDDFTTRCLSVRNSQNRLCNIWRRLDTYKDDQAPQQTIVEEMKRKFLSFRDGLRQCDPDSKENLLYCMLDPDPKRRFTALQAVMHPFVRAEFDQASQASDTSQPGDKRTASAR